ncbi:hypothetical protein N324_07083, partial [Chlamydotis macqueenii]
FGTLMDSSSTLFEISIPRGALENNKSMYSLKVKQHGSIGALDNMESHCALYSSSNILSTGKDLTFSNTYKNV